MALKSGGTSSDKIATGTKAQRPGSLSNADTGRIRFSTSSGHPEAYTGTTNSWKTIAYVGEPDTLPGNRTLSGTVTADALYYVNDLTISNNTQLTPKGGYTEFWCTGNVTIGTGVKFKYQETGAPPVGNNNQTAESVSGESGIGLCPGVCGIDVKSPIAPIVTLTGSSGSSGKKDNTGPGGLSAGQASGQAGGTIYIHAVGNITIGDNTEFNVNGSTANKNTIQATGSGSGGGSGGFIVIQAGGSLTIPSSCKFYARGGNGSNGRTSNLATAIRANGGGGGGGGYIILGARNGKYNVGGVTKDVTGGNKGNYSGSGTNGARAGSGGSCGGQGGHISGSSGAYTGVNGQNGQFLSDFLIS